MNTTHHTHHTNTDIKVSKVQKVHVLECIVVVVTYEYMHAHKRTKRIDSAFEECLTQSEAQNDWLGEQQSPSFLDPRDERLAARGITRGGGVSVSSAVAVVLAPGQDEAQSDHRECDRHLERSDVSGNIYIKRKIYL